ncbi:LOW QUALITY PROTEIN: glucokinase regulatory protein [Anableps anableps]
MFPFPLLPSCETHDNRTVVTARGARTPRHFPGTSCLLPSRAAATAVSLSRPGREEPSEPAAARGRLPLFFLPRAGHRPRAYACGSGGIWFSSTPAAPHHLLLRARSSRAKGGYDNRGPPSPASHAACRFPVSAATTARFSAFRSSSPSAAPVPLPTYSSLSLTHTISLRPLLDGTTLTPYAHLYMVPFSTEWEQNSADYEPTLPVSEMSNPITRDIDRAPTTSIVKMLQACDAQMFQEKSGAAYERLLSEQVVKTLMEVAERVRLTLKDPQDSLVILSGCGTSGRLAFFITSRFNRELRRLNHSAVCSYIIAGGDRALLSSQEAPEDDPILGVLSLKKVSEGKKRVLFIGISCGLSAPFVAGQLDFCLHNPDVYTPVLVGFNPAHKARSEPISGCSLTFHSVVTRMQELAKTQKAFLINPALGPEAISGSSRMKGGSATKILLEVVFSAAYAANFSRTPITYNGIQQHMRSYENTMDNTYSHTEGIAALMEAAGHSLQCGRQVCYLGWGFLGLLGLIDASECKPTFGADYEDIRGFVSGGYKELGNNEGDLSLMGHEFSISHDDFLHRVLPCLTDNDTVLLLYSHSDDVGEVANLARRVREKTSNMHAVYHQTDGDIAAQQDEINKLCSSTINFIWPQETSASMSLQHMWELSTKLLLNAVSTGAHILKGKVYQNYMIDLQVTNSKLYRRAARLLQKLSGHLESQCEEALLKAIYQVDKLTEIIITCNLKTHTHAARKSKKVVPLALVCLLTGCSIKEAESHLEEQPIIREAVEACLLEQNSSSGSL